MSENMKKMKVSARLRVFSAAAVALALLACWILPGRTIVHAENGLKVDMSDYAYLGRDFTGIDRAAKSVFYVEEYSADYKAFASGSGFIMFNEKLFITNQHVIEGASYLLIVDDDGKQYILDQVIISDKEHDIAILRFPQGRNYLPLPYDTDFDGLMRGQPVLTIGSPKGFPGTVSDGIISAFPKFQGEDIRRIQITAPISHGSSGGCLLNEELQVIGVTSSGVDEAQNLGFAIPVYIVEELYRQWNKKDTVTLGTKTSWDTVGSGIHKKIAGSAGKPQVPAGSSGKTAPAQTVPPAPTVSPTPLPAPVPTSVSTIVPTQAPVSTPVPVLSVTVSADSGCNRIVWNGLPDAAKYEVYRDGKLMITTKLTVYQDKGITSGTDYQYQVNAVLTSGAIISSESKRVSAAAPVKEPKIKAGDYITFGRYPQTAEGTDRTPIEWLVLDCDAANNRALLLSRYGLDRKPYGKEEWEGTTWEKCTLRMWLNRDFLNAAFTTAEQSAILMTRVDNSRSQGYSGYNGNGGNNTQDKIFLLSYKEANKYLGVTDGDTHNIKSRVEPTAYAKKNGAYTSRFNQTTDGTPAGWWWLRSPGQKTEFQFARSAATVLPNGSLDNKACWHDLEVVRPALWLDLESDIF